MPSLIEKTISQIEIAKTMVKGEKAKQYIVDLLNKKMIKMLSYAPDILYYNRGYLTQEQTLMLSKNYNNAFGRSLVKDYDEWKKQKEQKEEE